MVTEGDCPEELLQLSKSTFEEYFVAPPGKMLNWVAWDTCDNCLYIYQMYEYRFVQLCDDFGFFLFLTGNIPLPTRDKRAAILKHSEF